MDVIKLNKKEMKRILIIALALMSLNTMAQLPRKAMSNQEKVAFQTGFEKFYGTWEYEANGKTFTIVLGKKDYKKDRQTDGFLGGYHIYKEGGKVIDGDPKEATISVGIFGADDQGGTKISFRFRETEIGVRAKGTLEFKGGNPDMLIWKLVLAEGPGMVAIDGKKTDYRLHVPNNITLKRVK